MSAMPSTSVLVFALVVSLLTGIAFGIGPALAASGRDYTSTLPGVGRFTTRITLGQKSLVVLQAVHSLVLLSGAGLMIQTLRNLQNQQFGFQMEESLVVNVNAGFGAYKPERLAALYKQIEAGMRQIPNVRDAALALYSPMSGNNWQSGVTLEERPSRMVSSVWDRVSPSFFDTVGASLMRGRVFNDWDTPNSVHVAVVNETFADLYFPNENPIGKRFGLGGLDRSRDYEIVGVVKNLVFRNPRRPTPPPMFFVPRLQISPGEWANDGKARSNFIQCIMIRVAGDLPNLTSQIHRTLATVDPNLTVVKVMPMREQLRGLVVHEILITRLAELFGLLALALASVGLYGVTAYSATRRTSEIGIRTAFGATRSNVIGLILSGALRQTGISLIIGIPATLGAGRVLADLLYGVKTYDPVILAATALMLAICATVAGLIPALRASSIDPVTALRMD